MGTRHIIVAVIDGQTKLAQYGQWDGYPEGQGLKVLEFIRKLNSNLEDLPKFLENLRSTHFVTEDEHAAALLTVGVDANATFMTKEQHDAYLKVFPTHSRDLSTKVLDMILDTPDLVLQDNTSFAKDGLFCEWAYVLDFDKGHLEVYQGFHKEPAPEGHDVSRFGDEPDHHRGDFTYYPARLTKIYPFDAIPSDEDFVKDFASLEESSE